MVLFIVVVSLILFAIDFYAFQAIQTAFNSHETIWYKLGVAVYWLFTIVLVIGLIYMSVKGEDKVSKNFKMIFGLGLFLSMLSKLFLLLWLFGEDIYRVGSLVIGNISGSESNGHLPERRKLISRLALISAFIPLATLAYGILRNAYRYQFRNVKVTLKNLPESFKGFRIVHLSDIHSGSFNKTKPIEDVIEKINALEADLIVFTGDLVNDLAVEMDDYKSIFAKLRAKHGVMSVTGNHDYGLYTYKENDPVRIANFEAFKKVHADMGWQLLMDENRVIERGGEELAIIGVQNWGKARYFPKYGDLSKAIKGVERSPAKILLSHDPSHWDGEVIPNFPGVDLTLSGHTHGFQFGVETEHFKWSPSQYAYPQWAGLYRKGEQQLYVNRGFGFLGYPGRVGILPEITVLELDGEG